MSKKLAIDLLQKANNPVAQTFNEIEPDDDVSIQNKKFYKVFNIIL